ncbi:MAG: polysaccharide deacetylase family protein, partial [Pseudomonadota bacterium]
AQLRELQASDLIEVESHGKSHDSLARVKEDPDGTSYVKRLKDELEGSEAVFARRLGQTPTFMSYPYGNSSETIAQMLNTDGYKLAATVTRGPNGSFVDPFLLHRTMIFSDHSLDQFATFLVTEQPRR